MVPLTVTSTHYTHICKPLNFPNVVAFSFHFALAKEIFYIDLNSLHVLGLNLELANSKTLPYVLGENVHSAVFEGYFLDSS